MPTLATLAARARTLLSALASSTTVSLIEADTLRQAANLARAERRPTGMTRDQAAAWRRARDQIAAALEKESTRRATPLMPAADQSC